jgi:hypothetical protein
MQHGIEYITSLLGGKDADIIYILSVIIVSFWSVKCSLENIYFTSPAKNK